MKKLYPILFCLFSIGAITAQPAPDFLVTDAHGNPHQLYADYLDQGKSVVLKLFFVACPPCNQIAPHTETLYQDWGGAGNPDVEFFSITIQSNDNDADVLNYESRHSLTYPGISADGGAIAASQPYRNGTYGPFSGTPTFVVIAPDGTVNFDVFGAGISGTITALDNAIRDTRPVLTTNQTITLQIEDGIRTNDDFTFTLEGNGQSYAPDIGTDNAFTVPTGEDYEIGVEPKPQIVGRGGVSTFDLVLIAKFITGQNNNVSPKQIIAADVNNSQSVTTFDIIELRKFILRIVPDFTRTWVTIPADFVFTDPRNPWLDDFELKQVLDLQDDVTFGINPIRIGDFNQNTWNNFNSSTAETRSGLSKELVVQDQLLQAGQVHTIDISAKDFTEVLGYQFAISLDPELVELLEVIPEEDSGLSSTHFHKKNNQVTFSWFDLDESLTEQNATLFQLELKVKKTTNLSQILSLNDQLLKAEAYPQEGTSIDRIELVFHKPDPIIKKSDLQVSPNPMKDRGQVQYQIEQSGQIDLEIVSITGRIVQKLESAYREAGQYTLPIETLDRGMYFIRLLKDGEKLVTKRVAVF